MRKLIIYSSIQLYDAHHGGSEIRVLGYTAHLEHYLKDFCYCGPDKPVDILDEHYHHFILSAKWKKLMLLCNVIYQYLHMPLYCCRWLINRFSGIRDLIGLVSDGELLLIHQDCTVAEYLRIVEHTKYVYDIHGFFDIQREYFTLHYGFQRFIMYLYLWQERVALASCDFINVESLEMKEYVYHRFHPKGKILLAPDGIPADVVDYQTQKPIIAKRPYILFAGSYKPMGGVLDLMETYIHSARLQEIADLLVIGDGPELAMAKVKEFQSYVPEHIVLLPPMEHLKLIAYMKGATAIVCPDREDNVYNHVCPHIKLYDALATGNPIVATDLSVNRHIVPINYPIRYFGKQMTMECALIDAMNLAVWTGQEELMKLTYSYRLEKYWQQNRKILLNY